MPPRYPLMTVIIHNEKQQWRIRVFGNGKKQAGWKTGWALKVTFRLCGEFIGPNKTSNIITMTVCLCVPVCKSHNNHFYLSFYVVHE